MVGRKNFLENSSGRKFFQKNFPAPGSETEVIYKGKSEKC